MNGRKVLKQILFASAATIAIPACFQEHPSETEQLSAAADRVIPGVAAMGAPAFIMRMVSDCFSEQDREAFLKGMKENSDSFRKTVKDLTVQFYTSSKYYLTNIKKYELVPGRYHGCVNV